jgi:hypothetical protein
LIDYSNFKDAHLWKENLNKDGQQFHQYQQNKLSPLTSNNWTRKETTTYGIGNPYPGLGQTQTCCGIKPVNGIPTLSS